MVVATKIISGSRRDPPVGQRFFSGSLLVAGEGTVIAVTPQPDGV